MWEVTGKFFARMSAAIIALIFGAWVLTCLWAWFIVPLGLPQIGLLHAWGLHTTVSLLTIILPRQDLAPEFPEMLTSRILLNAIALVTRWIVHLLM